MDINYAAISLEGVVNLLVNLKKRYDNGGYNYNAACTPTVIIW